MNALHLSRETNSDPQSEQGWEGFQCQKSLVHYVSPTRKLWVESVSHVKSNLNIKTKRVCELCLSHAWIVLWDLSHMWNQIWISKLKECMSCVSLTRKVIDGICITCEIKPETQNKKSVWVLSLLRGKWLAEFVSHVESSESQHEKLGRSAIHKRICELFLSHAESDWWNPSHMWNQTWISIRKKSSDDV